MGGGREAGPRARVAEVRVSAALMSARCVSVWGTLPSSSALPGSITVLAGIGAATAAVIGAAAVRG